MAHNNKKYHELLSTVSDSLLTENGYPIKAKCNQNGHLNDEGTALVPGDKIIFGIKSTLLESAFDAFVVTKDMTSEEAKLKTDAAAWRL